MTVSTKMRDRTAICGVGMTEKRRPQDVTPDRTPLALATQAFSLALDDAGLTKDDVDGLVMLDFGAAFDRVLETFGIEVRFAHQGWHHGRFVGPTLMIAAMAVEAGLADVVGIVHATARTVGPAPASGDAEEDRQGLGPHGDSPVYGAHGPALGAALGARRYFEMYGGGNEDLAPIAVALRKHATLNPEALRREPLTIEDHQRSRWIVDPIRLLDCCQVNDGGACILVTSAERARAAKKPPAYVMGMQGVAGGRQHHNFSMPGLGVAQQDVYRFKPKPAPVYEMAGIDRSAVDSIALYDAFTPVVLYALEQFGFCGVGEAREFVKDGRIELGGELPVNTSGGLMSEGHLYGWNLFIEIVRQLRHECGPRQVQNAEVIQWANFLGDSILFRR